MWHLYIIRCCRGSLYTGITNDVERRFAEHQAQGPRTAKYLRGRGPLELIFHTEIGAKRQALLAERAVKRLSRARKQRLIEGLMTIEEIL